MKIILLFLLYIPMLMASPYVIKFSHVVSASTPKGKAADFFATRLEELSHNRIRVDVYPNGQLYTDKAVLKAIRFNSVQMAVPSFSKFATIIPQIELFDLPFIFRDYDHLHKVLDSEVGEDIKTLVRGKKFIALDFWDTGFKHFSSSQKLIKTPADASGQKFRIMSSHVLEEQMEALDASAQVLPFSEVYSALQQGVVDAAENPLSNLVTKKFYEVQPYVTLSAHGYLGSLVIMSERFWAKLPDELKPLVLQAMKEATVYERALAQELDVEYLNFLQDQKNVTVYTPSLKERKVWKATLEPIYQKFYDDDVIGKQLIFKVIETK